VNIKIFFVPIFLCVIVLAGCTPSPDSAPTESGESSAASSEIFAMDTFIAMSAYGERAAEAILAAEQEIYRLDDLLSTGKSSSEITSINQNGGGILSEDTSALIKASVGIYNETGGAFDITVYPLMQAWGFTSKNYRVPSREELDSLLLITGTGYLSYNEDTEELSFAREGMAIDLGGIAKGYASGRIMEIFKDYGIESALVSLGGNVHTLGTKPDGRQWRVGVQDPADISSNIGVLSISDKAAVTSGGYQRFFEEDGVTYHHILDPKTGATANSGLSSVTIVSDNGTLADGLSTALFVMGADAAAEFWRERRDTFDAVFVTDDGRILVTDGLADCFYSDYSYELISP